MSDELLMKEAMHLEAIDYQDWLKAREEEQLAALEDKLHALRWTARKFPYMRGTALLIRIVEGQIARLSTNGNAQAKAPASRNRG